MNYSIGSIVKLGGKEVQIIARDPKGRVYIVEGETGSEAVLEEVIDAENEPQNIDSFIVAIIWLFLAWVIGTAFIIATVG